MNEFIIDTSPSKEEWNEFIFNHEYGNIFQTYDMYEIYIMTPGFKPISIAVKTKKGELLGLLLAVIQYEKYLSYFSSRSIILGGPLIKNNDINALKFILKEYENRVRSKAIYSQIRNTFSWDEARYLFEENGFNYSEHLTIRHNLLLTLKQQFAKIHKGRRKNIRRADRRGVQFHESNSKNELNIIYSLIKNNYKAIKLPVPEIGFFMNCFSILKKKKYIKIFHAKFEDEIIAARIVLCFKGLIYDWYTGTDPAYLDKYPNDFLPWKIIEWGSNNDMICFDFGGAGKPGIPYGVREHKLKFGGDLVQYGRFEKIHNKGLFQLGKYFVSIYKTFVK